MIIMTSHKNTDSVIDLSNNKIVKILKHKIDEQVAENKKLLNEKSKTSKELYELYEKNHELEVQIDSMSEIILDLEASNDVSIKR
ncbi:hypothetical protein [Clostridium akagii]|uniref:hypothetical protein n=1 Tax=Clostridium akagii TaxID=91623 RepID=UPI00047E3EBF|nr:hypothetical protein [Clostridium akagii]